MGNLGKTPLIIAWFGRFGNRGLSLENNRLLSFYSAIIDTWQQMIGFAVRQKENKKSFCKRSKRCYNTFTGLADSRNHVFTGVFQMTKSIVRVLASGAAVLAGEYRAPRAATAKATNYTPEQEAVLTAAATNAGGMLDSKAAEMFAADFGKTVKSVVAKMSRMGIYKKKEYTTKTGDAVVKKDDHADAIGAILRLTEAETDSLTKANKTALAKIFTALANSKPIDGNE